MKKCCLFLLIAGLSIFDISELQAQCSICTKTASQLGEKPGKALNGGILYLAAAPIMIMGFIGYRWYKSNQGPN